jgi:hypothetical protein
MSNLEEFERWTAGLLEARYCAAWTHYRVGDLWQAVRGAQSLPLTPVACLAGACPHRPAPAVLADWRGGIAAAFSSASLLAPPRPRVRGVATDQDPLGRTPVPDEPGPQPVSALLPDVPAAVAPEASDG